MELTIHLYLVALALGNLNQHNAPKQSNWMKHVIKYIHKDLTVHQVMMISINAIDDLKINKVYQDFRKTLPTVHFNASYAKERLELFNKIKSFQSPRGTTLFVITESPENKSCTLQTEEVMGIIKNLSTVKIRPKCLILRFLDSNDNSVYVTFLQRMWQSLFLDVTIFDVTKAKVTIHQMNPFISYKRYPFSRKSCLFPDKLRNLNGYPIKVGVFDRIPYVQVKRNSTKHPVQISGPDAFIWKTFSEVMNYRQLFISSNEEEFGKFSCSKKSSKGFMNMVVHNTIQFLTVRSTLPKASCSITEDLIFGLDGFIAIVPVMKSNELLFSVSSTFYDSFLLIVFIILISSIIQLLFRFDKLNWKWFVIVQILLGMSVTKEPQKLRERIIFGSFLVTAFFYSSDILASLTKYKFQEKKEIEINSLEELVKSGLQLGISPNVAAFIPMVYGKKHGFTVLAKSGKLFAFNKDCINFLIQHRNISCVVRRSFAEWYAKFYREMGLVRFSTEYIYSGFDGYWLEPGSPYVEKFQKLQMSLTEYALIDKWEIKRDVSFETNIVNLQKQELNENVIMRELLMKVLLVGYSAAILIFFAEMILGRRRN